MADRASNIAYPEWTEIRKKNGRDPLGMQTSSISLYQTFLPGISNVTLRIRYYGLYAWLSQVYAEKISDTDPKTWQRFIRRAEALYALVAQRRGSETGVGGIQWAEITLQTESSRAIDFSAAAEPGSDIFYLKQAWGVYGLYASQLYNLGVFEDVERHRIPVPGPEIGFPLATAFAKALGTLSDSLFKTIQKGTVTLDELDKLAPITPSSISHDSAERDCYEKILFARAGLGRSTDIERRRTLLLILYLSSKISQVPAVSDVRWMLYTGYSIDETPLAFHSEELTEHRLRWWIYQANDLIHISYEILLKYVLDVLEPYSSGVILKRLINDVLESLRTVVDDWPESWEEFLLQNLIEEPKIEVALSATSMQDARDDRICSPKGAWDALKLIAVVHNRSLPYRQKIKNELEPLDPYVFRTLLTEINFLESHAKDDFTLTISKLIEQRIIQRHLWVALQKLRHQGDYTFLLESDDGRVRLHVKDGPIFTNPRLGPAITFLEDIHLINQHGLTELGRKVLDTA